MSRERQGITILPETDKWDHDIDVKRFLLQIHRKTRTLKSDLVLFTSDEKDRDFINGQHKVAYKIAEYIQDKRIAEQAATNLLNEVYLRALLKRNTKDNQFGMKLLAPDTREDTTAEKEVGTIRRLLDKKKEPTEE